MLTIFKNNFNRLWEEKAYLIISTFLTICAVAAAILLTNKVEVKGNIAVVSKENNAAITNCKYFNITVLKSKPKKSELVQNRYDAIVTRDKGNYKINTIKSNELKNMLAAAIRNPKGFVPPMGTERRVGTNIIGYIMMFILIQGVLYARFFAEDKEKQMIKRVAISPIAFTNYLLGHAIFMIVIIMVPTFIVIAAAKLFGAAIGFSLLHYAVLLLILSMMSTAFALFLNSFFCTADTANMLGSAIILLTSILAGSFYSFSKNRELFNKILHVIPQKDFINYVDALEKGAVSKNLNVQLGYVIGLIVFMFIFAIVKTRRDYVYNK
jgi:ABC-2 type transport system permease protein